MEEVKPVVTEKYDLESKDLSFFNALLEYLDYHDSYARNKIRKLSLFDSPKHQYFRLGVWWKKSSLYLRIKWSLKFLIKFY